MAIHGLFIGNNYKGTDYSLPDCEIDARGMTRAFGQYCLTHELLLGPRASREGIISAGAAIKSRLRPGDLWLITNSGHGTQEKKGGKRIEAIVCDGGELIYDFEFAELLGDERPEATVVFAISDSCFSGGLERNFRTHIARSVHIDRVRPHKVTPPKQRPPAILPADPFFSGCNTNEESFSTGKGGAMTLAVLKTFREQLGQKSFAEWFAAVGGKGGLLPSSEWPQHPQCQGSPENLARTFISFFKG